MDGPGQGSATDHGLMRASREDRERVIDVIKTAFVQDRLDLDELAGRVGQALTARTYGQLAALTADLPGSAPLTACRPDRIRWPPGAGRPSGARTGRGPFCGRGPPGRSWPGRRAGS